MKKIFTLAIALSALSTVFAQRGSQHTQAGNQPGQASNQPAQNGSYSQPGYNKGANTTVYTGPNQQQGNWNNGNQSRENNQRDYARNDQFNRGRINDRFNERQRFEMDRRRGNDYYRNDRFSRGRYNDRDRNWFYRR